MAERRMFSKKIVDSDAFLDLPITAQLVYFHLLMNADDEGFINNPKRVARSVGCKSTDVQVLIDNRFLLSFPSGVVVVKHWFIHNCIRKDRAVPTTYTKERNMVVLGDNNVYTEADKIDTECQPNDNQTPTKCQPNANQMSAQDSIGKDRIVTHKKTGERACVRDSSIILLEFISKTGLKDAYFIADFDYALLADEYDKSKKLLQRAPFQFMADHYDDVIKGKYRDFKALKHFDNERDVTAYGDVASNIDEIII